MKVAVSIDPLTSGHSVRGIGSYTKNLVDEFRNNNRGIDFDFFEDRPNGSNDLIHYPFFDLFFHTLPISDKTPRVVTIHDVIPLIFPKYFPVGVKGNINLLLQKMALKNVRTIICDSTTSKNDIVEKFSVPSEKVHVVLLAPGPEFKKINNPKFLEKAKRKFNLREKFALYVGDVNWNKNLENLLLSIVISKIPLVMVGKSLTDKNLTQVQALEDQIKEMDLHKLVYRAGYISSEDLVSIYNLALLTVLPSYYEGFGLPVLESMACGTPVVCSDVASLSEIAKPFAFLCDPSNPKDIADKVKKVASLSQNERNVLSEKLQAHSAEFTWKKVADRTIHVYKSAIKMDDKLDKRS